MPQCTLSPCSRAVERNQSASDADPHGLVYDRSIILHGLVYDRSIILHGLGCDGSIILHPPKMAESEIAVLSIQKTYPHPYK